MANLLATETSPYLLMHKDNPVNWRPWGQEALAEASRTGKPLYVCIGFAACWPCVLMNRENFQDAEISSMLNDNFVCVLVDRAERPDIDVVLQTAAQMMQSAGGWPLNMFLTPQGVPFAGGSFFPKEDQPEQGLTGFKTAIRNVLTTLRENPAQVSQNVETLRTSLTKLWMENRRLDGQLSPMSLEQAARRVCQSMDVFGGGLNGLPKFPNLPIVEMMWRAFLRNGATQFAAATNVQLQTMSAAGIYDHVGGGYSRFAQDEYWMIPHFEKMLSDNAQIIEALTTVWQDNRLPAYKTRVEETIAWLQREMVTPEGAFAASAASPSNGDEGTHIVWTAREIDAVLGLEDAKLFKQVYDVRDNGNWRDKSILNRMRFVQVDPVVEGRLNGMRQRLLDARMKRAPAEIDGTILADANGLAIRAITVAADAYNRIEWQAMAVRAFWFIADKMASGGKLHHSYRSGHQSSLDFADDYASMALSAITLFEATGDARYLEKATLWFAELDNRFWTQTAGGYALTPSDADEFFVRPRVSLDRFTPSANSLATKVAAQLYFHTGNTHYRDRANETIIALTQDTFANVALHASLFNALDGIIRTIQIVVVGERSSPDVAAIRDVLRRISLPNKILQIVSATDALPASHPARGKPKVQGRATVYLCNATQSSPPITDPNQLELALKTRTVSA